MYNYPYVKAIAFAALLLPGFTQAEFIRDADISFILSSDVGMFMQDGATIGDKETVFRSNDHDIPDVWRFQNRMRVFMNVGLGESNTLHAEGNFVIDPRAEEGFQTHRLYSQFDYFRELYLDSFFGSENQFSTRLGKQQIVWGTADGIKLLDIINPTDFRHFVQDPFEDSRIPVWMAVGEYNPVPSINLQAIVAQSRPNVIPGLDVRSSGDSGQPFIANKGQPFVLKGVDTITGQVDGFLNITPALGATAAAFQGFAAAFGAPNLAAVGGGTFTVQDFVNGQTGFCGPNAAAPGAPTDAEACPGFLNSVAQTPGLGGNENRTNLVTTTYNSSDPKFTFEYMNLASFATFDTFARARSEYRKDLEEDAANFGFRFKQETDFGVNYSLNYYYNQNPNPAVEVFWEDQSGNRLNPVLTEAPSAIDGSPVKTVALQKANGQTFTPTDINPATSALNENDGVATLVFREFQDRIHNIGASFDSGLDFMPLPTVLRGEFLYQKDVLVPIIDRSQLAVGNVAEALTVEKADFFKYVLGLDVTVFTNLLVSTQLIQFWNLDYVSNRTDSVFGGPCQNANCGRYTGDPSTLALSNGLKKGDEVETFGSLFLSKPFGAEQQHRVNNIFIAENGGGFWNRLDVEYTFTEISENLVGTAAFNYYFGDDDTTFGQLENSSNLQIGLKYLFDPEPL
jgi:Protein of unknown function (DUF1302)